VQVLDFPLPTGKAVAAGETRTRYPSGSTDPFQFLRRVTTLMLEGRPRTSAVPVYAPLPSRAADITTDLMDDRFRDLNELHRALHDNRQHPAEVTTGLRAGHVSATAVLCGLWLFLMLFMSTTVNWWVAFAAAMGEAQSVNDLAALDTPAERREWIAEAARHGSTQYDKRTRELFEKHLAEERAEQTLAAVRAKADRQRAVREDWERRLNPVEVAALKPFVEQTARQLAPSPGDRRGFTFVSNLMYDLERPDEAAAEDAAPAYEEAARVSGLVFACVVAQWPLLWFPLFALMFRGGVARWIAGLQFVRRDGRPASVWVCGLRAVLAWLPLLLLLLLVIALQVYLPYWVYVRTAVWLAALALLGGMAFVALRRPEQTPLDRLFKLFIVPA
jgi:hypothetical protein